MPEGEECLICAKSRVFRLFHREFFLLLLLGLIALGSYFGTRAFANVNREMKAKVAYSWYQQGSRLLDAGQGDEAVVAFRKAIVNDRDNRLYAQALARALEMAGRDKEAEGLLLQLRESAPEDPQVNVELGRIAVRQGNIQDAIRYYHNALYGIWSGEQIDLRRTDARRELINFLIAQHARDQALAEILALRAHLSNDPVSDFELGGLFMRVDDPQRALQEFHSVLQEQPHNQPALQGAGEAAFQIGDYVQARRFLSAVAAPDSNTKNLLELATLVIENDPFEPRLSDQERERRLLADFNQAAQHLLGCLAQQAAPVNTTLLKSVQEKLDALRPLLTPAHLKSDPNLSTNALELIYEAEDATSRSCGQPQGFDMALLLIAQESRRAEQ